jgi:ferredoxin--NADP+ reductase
MEADAKTTATAPTPAPDRKYITAVVTMRREVTTDLWVMRLQPQSPITFRPGQYLTLGLPSETKMIERPYSVVSSPADSELEFFIELVHDGKLTPMLYQLAVGGTVNVRPTPKGKFLLDEESGNKCHLMVGSVTGVVPYISIVRSLIERSASETISHRILMLHSASVPTEFGYDEELANHARTHPWLTYAPTVSRVRLAPDWTGERGRAEDVVRKHLDAAGFPPAATTAYVCGNPQMIKNVQGVLERAGLDRRSIREELYWPDPT